MVFFFFMMAPLVQFCTHGDHGRQVYDICKDNNEDNPLA